MPVLKRRKPCADCPFRRDALKGWLGEASPREFLIETLGEEPMPCQRGRPQPRRVRQPREFFDHHDGGPLAHPDPEWSKSRDSLIGLGALPKEAQA